MLFLAALLHAIIILGLTFAAPGRGGDSDTPQLDVLMVTDEVPEADANERAVYLAQRTQAGSGNTDQGAARASPASRGAPDLRTAPSPASGADPSSASPADQPVLASSAPSSEI